MERPDAGMVDVLAAAGLQLRLHAAGPRQRCLVRHEEARPYPTGRGLRPHPHAEEHRRRFCTRRAELFQLPLVAINTSLLLLSSITYGFVVIAMGRNRRGATLAWLAVTGLLGAGFVGIELHEFAHLIEEGNGPQRSAFLSSFFTLVGTHGLYVTFCIVWLLTLNLQVPKRGLHAANMW